MEAARVGLTSLVYVQCDVCGNPCGGTDGMRDSAKAARSYAQASGWIQRPARESDDFYRQRHGARLADVCPDCQD